MTAGRRAVVDTNVFGAELTRRGVAVAGAYPSQSKAASCSISFVTVAEVVWAGGGLVDAYVSLRHECAVEGHPLGQKHHEADRWIAATACWLDVPLVAHDVVFRNAPGVTLVTELA